MNAHRKFVVFTIIVFIFSSTLIQTTFALDVSDIEVTNKLESSSTDELMTFNLKKISQFDFGKKVISLQLKSNFDQ